MRYSQQSLSLVHGSTSTPLWHKTIGTVLQEQAQQFGDRTAVIVPWQNVRHTFKDLHSGTEATARAFLANGIKKGDRVAIMAGNRIEYIEVFLAASRVGCALVVLNNTYTPSELVAALQLTSTKIVFLAQSIGGRSLSAHIEALKTGIAVGNLQENLRTVILEPGRDPSALLPSTIYSVFKQSGERVPAASLRDAEHQVKPEDVVNMQFTSGTTGTPKAAMLTHLNIVNNGRLVGARMGLTHNDVVCCPPPLFHCFGLVMGFLAALTHGSSIVFPTDQFNASLTLDTMAAELCTAVLGVPTMFIAMLSELPAKQYKIDTVRTGLAAGSMVPRPLLERLDKEMGIGGVLIAYGMTETSPVTFMMDIEDPPERLRKGLGKVMPHTSAKVVDSQGHILSRGSRGELCVSGYALMTGYFLNEVGTNDVMRRDESGVLWMHTGDECSIDDQGYCEITGRIKDLIIRGGENIFPAEIEDRLLKHPSICEASVVGLPDSKYGEVVSCFVRAIDAEELPSDQEVMAWVGAALGRQKIPAWVFWVGEGNDCALKDYPKTGSGKHQKNLLRALGKTLLERKEELLGRVVMTAKL